MGGAAFRVRGKMFAMWREAGGRTILKLPREFQFILFETRPEAFEPCKVGTGTWSYVDIEALQDAEVKKLVLKAWSTVVPKSLSTPVMASHAA